jgi:hypothetical protein
MNLYLIIADNVSIHDFFFLIFDYIDVLNRKYLKEILASLNATVIVKTVIQQYSSQKVLKSKI